ncbi:MAG TPA: hypothetical protein VD788_01420, partial [Candidatus Polarisedimenticolaceae bacterium]|nr:hypothetical protein [Candidatus Polarisedimenticolaceae bacterium]
MRASNRGIAGLAGAALFLIAHAATPAQDEEPPKLLGRCTTSQLDQEPYAEWFRAGYADYRPNAEVLASLRRLDLDRLGIDVFFGTWCGDSRRELPRLLKLLDELD